MQSGIRFVNQLQKKGEEMLSKAGYFIVFALLTISLMYKQNLISIITIPFLLMHSNRNLVAKVVALFIIIQYLMLIDHKG
jgi:hypothetical protein